MESLLFKKAAICLIKADLVILIIFQVFVKIHWISNRLFPLFRRIKLNISENLCIGNRYDNIVLNHFGRVWLFVTLWTVAHRLLCPWRFSRQKYWVGLPCLPPGDLLNPGIKPTTLISPTLAGGFFNTSTTWESNSINVVCKHWCLQTLQMPNFHFFKLIFHYICV